MVYIDRSISAGSRYFESWNVLNNTIAGSITDLHSPVRSSSNFIFGSYPNTKQTKSNKFVEFPIIVIGGANMNGNHFCMNRQLDKFPTNFTVDVYDTNQVNVEKIAGNVIKIVEDEEDTLCFQGLKEYKLVDSADGSVEINGQNVHVKTVVLGFVLDIVR